VQKQKKRYKPKNRLLNTENKLVDARGEMGGGWWVKEMKRSKNILILMSPEKCTDLLNHYIVYLKLI